MAWSGSGSWGVPSAAPGAFVGMSDRPVGGYATPGATTYATQMPSQTPRALAAQPGLATGAYAHGTGAPLAPAQPPAPAQPSPRTGSRMCKHLSPDGRRCDAPPVRNGLCERHVCWCGGEKSSSASLCPNCAATQHHRQRWDYIATVGAPSPGAKPPSKAKAKPRRAWLFIWDFDRTITRTHASQRPLPIPDDDIRRDFVDLEFFARATAHLHRLGHFVKVASWAHGPEQRRVVCAYLRVALGPNDRRTYLRDEGLETFQPRPANLHDDGKNTHIENLRNQINASGTEVPRDRVVLFDDNERNIAFARDAGYRCVHCPRGFGQAAWQSFIKSFGDTPPDFHSDDLYRDPSMARRHFANLKSMVLR